MAVQRLPDTVHTLYAELLDRAVAAEAETVAQGLPPPGSFVSKRVKGNTYWYLQRSVAGKGEQRYLGPESPALRVWMDSAREARGEGRADEERRAELVDMLVAGGATPTASAPGRVLEGLAAAGVFRLGAVLVGTQAFLCLANVLGAIFERRHVRTGDVDLAHDPRIAVAAPEEPPADVPAALRGADPAFFGVPGFDPREPSTSFSVRGRDLRVDLVTPLRGRETEEPVVLRRLGAAARPLAFLDYLLEETIQAVLLYGSGVLVNLPHPARFALHKVWLADQRPAAMHARARKDMNQAEALLEVLLEDRPRDLREAWVAIRGKRRGQVRRGLERLRPEIRAGVLRAAGEGAAPM
ncbi:MAG TPA: GSU2403 family nucleotidyltransferase fold protein [Thermoanaerobaculia bacterium]|nr:GSU2403 family nucleotidyltransferase fold protein [Thermoanaerobaculia bacterium]